MTAARRHEYRVIGDLLSSDRKLYEKQLRRAREARFVAPDKDIPFETMRDFLLRGAYTLQIPPQAHLKTELATFQSILENVSARNWSLMTAGIDAPDFITCDHPVSIVHKQLVFPLDARHALMGDREQRAPRRFDLRAPGVAEVNSRLFKLADRQIYSRTPEAAFFDGDNAVTIRLNDMKNDAAGPPQQG